MKNKTIYMGPSGSGKSYKALEELNNKGTTIILNSSTTKKTYEEDFPPLKTFTEKDCRYPFKITPNGTYFIKNLVGTEQTKYASEFVNALIQGCDYGTLKDDPNARVLFDDGSWERLPDRLLTLWQLSHVECGISITIQSIEDLLNIGHSDFNEDMLEDMLEDIKKYWNIVYCSRSDWDKSQ